MAPTPPTDPNQLYSLACIARSHKQVQKIGLTCLENWNKHGHAKERLNKTDRRHPFGTLGWVEGCSGVRSTPAETVMGRGGRRRADTSWTMMTMGRMLQSDFGVGCVVTKRMRIRKRRMF